MSFSQDFNLLIKNSYGDKAWYRYVAKELREKKEQIGRLELVIKYNN